MRTCPFVCNTKHFKTRVYHNKQEEKGAYPNQPQNKGREKGLPWDSNWKNQ